MDFQDIVEKYPLHDTLIGEYGTDYSFEVNKLSQVIDIDKWIYAPLDWGENYMPFIRYQDNKFECWYFAYNRVCGYFTADEEGFNYKLVIKFNNNYEIIDPDNLKNSKTKIMIPDEVDCALYDCDWNRMVAYENMLEHVARVFDPIAYKEGRILTSYDAIKKFVAKLEKQG